MVENHDQTFRADRFLALSPAGSGPTRFNMAEAIDVPVSGGTVRVYRMFGSGKGRPVLFVPGWGSVPETFYDFFGAVAPEIDIYYIETREKRSSSIDRRTAQFDMDRFCADLQSVMESLSLDDQNPVILGSCFGSAIILQGIARGMLKVQTVVCLDPMIRLWIPRWVVEMLRFVVPAVGLHLLRPLIRTLVLAGMRAQVQRARALSVMNSAILWKWRKAAIHLRSWNLKSVTAQIQQRVYVINGSHDRFHNADLFPAVARSIPDGVFIRIPVGESRRERLLGAVANEFAMSQKTAEIPDGLRSFVVSTDKS